MSAFGYNADMALCGNPLSRSLLGVKRTSLFARHMSAFDPKRTFSVPIPTQLLPACISALQCLVRHGHADAGGPGTQSWRGLVKLSRHAGPERIASNL